MPNMSGKVIGALALETVGAMDCKKKNNNVGQETQ